MRVAGALLLGCVLLAGDLRAQTAPQEPVAEAPAPGEPAPATGEAPKPGQAPVPRAAPKETRIYGVEVESGETRDRVLVFADGPVRPKLEEVDRGTVMLVFPGASLDPSAPKEVPVEPGGAVVNVTAFETAGAEPEVRITILRGAGISPRLSRRGQQVALDFQRPRRRTPAPSQARTPEPPAEPTIEARWLNMPIQVAVERLARFVDVRLILDGTLRGNVSIDAVEPLTLSEAGSMIDALLLMKGYAAVLGPAGVRKVVPLASSPGPWVEQLAANPDETPLVTIVRLRDIDAAVVLQAIEPLVGQGGLAELHARTNGILLAGPGNRLARIADVMRSLDESGFRRLVMIPLRHADAEATADVLLASDIGRAGARLEVWPDVRTNRLVVRGRPDAVERARSLIARLDRPAEGDGRLQVVPVRFMDPDRLAEILRGLATQQVTSGVRGASSLAGRDLAVSVHGPTHSLVVQSDPETISLVRELVAELDQSPAMVNVEVMVAELAHSNTLELSLDAIIPIVEPDALDDLLVAAVVSPSGSVLSTTSDRAVFARVSQTAQLFVPFVDPVTGTTVSIPVPRFTSGVTADATDVSMRVLLYPQLSMVSGEEHEIFVGQNVPVPTAETGASNPLRTSQTIERRDTGVSVRVLPTVPKEGPIALDLSIEVSAVSGIIPGGTTFTERTLDVTARLQPGRTAMIGWARLPTSLEAEVGTPYLKDIPIIGALFRRTETMELSRLLLITARAELERPEAKVLARWMARELAERASVAAPPRTSAN